MPFNTGIQSGVALGNAEFGLHLKKKLQATGNVSKEFGAQNFLKIFLCYVSNFFLFI